MEKRLVFFNYFALFFIVTTAQTLIAHIDPISAGKNTIGLDELYYTVGEDDKCPNRISSL